MSPGAGAGETRSRGPARGDATKAIAAVRRREGAIISGHDPEAAA